MDVREEDGTGSKRLSKFNELIAGVRAGVPDMIIQVGGSISFSPNGRELSGSDHRAVTRSLSYPAMPDGFFRPERIGRTLG